VKEQLNVFDVPGYEKNINMWQYLKHLQQGHAKSATISHNHGVSVVQRQAKTAFDNI